MKPRIANTVSIVFCLATVVLTASLVDAQSSGSESSSALPVPRLVKFSGTVDNDQSAPRPGTAGITFSLYKDEQGGEPLWMEIQNVAIDSTGHYTVQLGATEPNGLPIDMFASGEARWLGVQIFGQPEQVRGLLLSVPYALKAGDAETISGLPASAFVLAVPGGVNASASASSSSSNAGNLPDTTDSGTAYFIPIWTNSSGALGNSVLKLASLMSQTRWVTESVTLFCGPKLD